MHIYTSREEWEAIGPEWRKAINIFKLPCHLNRGLCRLKKDDLDHKLWDFSEALRTDSKNVKGLYHRGAVLTRLIEREMTKEEAGEVWDLEKAEKRATEARADLVEAVKLIPRDFNIRKALDALNHVREKLLKHRKKYQADQKKLFSTLIHNLDKNNQRLAEEEEKGILDEMPELERVRIS